MSILSRFAGGDASARYEISMLIAGMTRPERFRDAWETSLIIVNDKKMYASARSVESPQEVNRLLHLVRNDAYYVC